MLHFSKKKPDTELNSGFKVDPVIVLRLHAITLWILLLATGCTSIQDDNGQPPDEVIYAAGERVSRCNLKSHLKCIYLTGAETIGDGRRVKWTRHWFRMSYIGRACEAQYGETTGIILESLFAIPHYAGIAIGNTMSLLLYTSDPYAWDVTKETGDIGQD